MKVIISIFFREFICASQRGRFTATATLNRHTLITPLMRVVSFDGVVGGERLSQRLSLKDISMLICFRSFQVSDVYARSCRRDVKRSGNSSPGEQIQHHNGKPPLFFPLL